MCKKGSGGGCILAHCMGLGKTFTTICFTLTLLSAPLLTSLIDPIAEAEKIEKDKLHEIQKKEPGYVDIPDIIKNQPLKNLFHTVLILAPVNTLKNWEDEYRNWTPVELRGHTNVRLITAGVDEATRIRKLRQWHTEGGVLIMGYNMFRLMTGDVSENKPDKKSKNVPTPTATATATSSSSASATAALTTLEETPKQHDKVMTKDQIKKALQEEARK